MAELWFYHLERTGVDEALPELLTKLTERGGRALIVSPDPEQVERLDGLLWTFRDEAFLAHGRADAPDADRQPILLSTEETNLNQAGMLFCLDGHAPEDASAFERSIVMFDGGDETRVRSARDLWRKAKADGLSVSYWKQTPEGRWEKKA
ncbi:MAG: DNA polymerase III subunit chi [Pseudomonadota bacterium]